MVGRRLRSNVLYMSPARLYDMMSTYWNSGAVATHIMLFPSETSIDTFGCTGALGEAYPVLYSLLMRIQPFTHWAQCYTSILPLTG